MLDHADEEKMIDSLLKAQRTQRIHGGNFLFSVPDLSLW
ncbi:MAG: hypothetical protein [Olavius algarvensis Gamma 1 endosymbiont]|nr:MAG: hypothetical protein [Olavius algarvensis Gamma 1 endosymbiont]